MHGYHLTKSSIVWKSSSFIRPNWIKH